MKWSLLCSSPACVTARLFGASLDEAGGTCRSYECPGHWQQEVAWSSSHHDSTALGSALRSCLKTSLEKLWT